MADYCNIRAPQWIDFTQNCSPVQIQDFFEKEHTVHERIEESCNSTVENMENAQHTSQVDVLCVNAKAQADLDIIRSTPVKVISPKYRNNKETAIAEVTYDQVFNDAMRKLELCKKMPKTRDVLNKSIQEPKIFKTPSMPKITKSSRSVGCVLNKNNQSNQDSAGRPTKINKTSSNYMKKMLVKQSLFEQDKDSAENDTFKTSNPVDDSTNKKAKQCHEEDNEECKEEDNNKEHNEKDNKEHNEKDNTKEHNKEDNKKHNEEDNKKLQDGQVVSTNDNEEDKKAGNSQDDVDAKGNRMQSIKQVAVLTWQNHRRSMHKRKTSVNKQYIGLAEAVSRFQNETPKRFRTKSNKDNTISPSFYVSKLTQNRLKPTIPISPALVSKNRTRPVTVLSQEEREKLEMEEMKKHRIKANPIPSNVLRGPRATTKVNGAARKPMVIANTSSAIQPDEKTKSSFQSKSDKAPSGLKNTITNVVVTDSEGIIVQHEEMAFFGVPKNTTKNVTRIVPFSFEARNKDMQMKKEQRLKNLQEASKTKAEFHARPAPNFSKSSTSSSSTKPSTPSAKQQQNAKKLVLPSSFSFKERDRKLSEKKEQLVKQVLEESKRSRVFRANPAPVFKPVMVRGTSKEHLSVKNKSMKTESEHNAEYKCENQENKEPNGIDSYITEGENMQTTEKSSACNDDKQKVPLKALPLELNTDKRAKERRAFDEKLKRKEMEEETKRQEQERKQMEHEKQLKAELRKLAEIKARPMPKYKLPIIAKATKQLTNPQSPAFASKLRSKQV
ncbi:targeting protein for Xklp2 homolog [Formica exsecta]|uniref:targeting protein for Xklp2 homolog n=1 Tax=Formica exsecta TaxID=72781 RepID=UPI001144D9CD|nr:targeting protein for Xklp2 homolog [Formica exsecta]